MLRAIIFDLDGVVADSHPAHKRAWSELLASLGRIVSAQDLEYVVEGRKRDEIMRHFLGELTREQLGEYGTRKDSLFAHYSADLQPVAGVGEFLEQVRAAGIVTALASSAGRRRVEANLEQLGLAAYFQFVVTGDDVIRGKPDPALFTMAAKELRVSSEETLVCEDAVNGVQAAKAAGMKCLAITSPGREMVLKAAGADKIVRDFTHIPLDELGRLFADAAQSHAAASSG
ncbi:MAG TPA: HAD family phosphatase [Terriglobales bacterium]|nr:HAD family phosphatase [Terriglobales bacterium]